MKPSRNHKTWPKTSIISELGWTILNRIIIDLIDSLKGIEKGGALSFSEGYKHPGGGPSFFLPGCGTPEVHCFYTFQGSDQGMDDMKQKVFKFFINW